MYGWIVKRLRNAEAEHIKNGEDKLAVLCRDAASVVVELNAKNKILRDLLHDRDSAIDALNVSLDTYRGLTEAMQHNQYGDNCAWRSQSNPARPPILERNNP